MTQAAKSLVIVSTGTCGFAKGAGEVAEAFRAELQARGLADTVELRVTGCHGFCEAEPFVVVDPGSVFYCRASSEDVAEIVEKTICRGELVDRLLYCDPQDGKAYIAEQDVPFYARQMRTLMSRNALIDPTSIDDYLVIDGYGALRRVLAEMKPEEVVEAIKTSGLRGRGGGGFPTGVKWETCRDAHGEPRYVICNADEGDPGAYMDRSVLEGNPHSVLEGMLIGAYAIGSSDGYIYVRAEYPLAVKHVRIAVDQARERGILGGNVFGLGFSFDIKIVKGGGAFVCGESTALMASIEGKPGEPRAKHIHTVESGLWGKPTTLNNVETWANVPLIIEKGADWYAQIGTKGSKGTKIFSLVGNITNTGLVEVPMGTPLRKIIYEIGGGIPEGKEFKAVQTGGPSGGCLPAAQLDLPVDFDELYDAGSMMGSGGMIVMDEDTCMVDVARYFLGFLKDESCGKCVPCREGVDQMHAVLTDITEGRGKDGDIELLESLADTTAAASLCALGQTSANPVLSTLRYFRDEYEAHIQDRKCPGRTCKALISYSISEDNCTGCGACWRRCPSEAITGEKKQTHVIDPEKCIRCGVCKDVCRFDAVMVA